MWGEIQMAGASSWNNQPPGLVSQLHKHSFQQLLNGPIKNKTHTPPKKKKKPQKIQCSEVKAQEEGLEETESSKAK